MPRRLVLLALGALALGCEDKYLLLRDGEFIIVNATIDGDIVIKDCSSNDSLNCTDKITLNLCQRSCRNCPAPASPPSSPIAKDTTPPPPSPTTMPTTPPPPSSPTPLAPASMAPTSPLHKGEKPAATSASAPQSASVGVAAAPSPSPTPGPPEEDPCAASAASGLLSPTDECRVYHQSAHAAPDAHADAPRSSTSSWDTWGPLVVLAAAAYCVYRLLQARYTSLRELGLAGGRKNVRSFLQHRPPRGIEGISLVDDFKCAARSSEADLGASQPSGFGRPGHGGRAQRGARDEDDDNEML
uniref:Uncharacterized protein n=1 Tax=Emiliania huxleyi TaxID=2903 RepID=A0A7S3VX03_EMIHU